MEIAPVAVEKYVYKSFAIYAGLLIVISIVLSLVLQRGFGMDAILLLVAKQITYQQFVKEHRRGFLESERKHFISRFLMLDTILVGLLGLSLVFSGIADSLELSTKIGVWLLIWVLTIGLHAAGLWFWYKVGAPRQEKQLLKKLFGEEKPSSS
jgi:hypothetical protein